MADNVFNFDSTGSNPLNYLEQAFGTIYPKVPSGTPPAADVNNNIAGNFDTGPNPGKSYQLQNDNLNSIANAIYSAGDWAQDKNQYGRAIDYGAGYLGSNFERYYSHDQYQKLGFNPFRDNEAIYNANSTWSDDFARMTGQYASLFGAGFKSFYDFGSENTANTFERAMAVGSTTKGGVGGFFTNLTLNSAFTMGIAFEMLAENFAIAAATAATGGLAAPVAALRMGGRMGEIGSSIKKVFDYNKGLKSTGQLLHKLDDPVEAKRYFDSAQAASTTQKFMNFANPLREVTAYTKNLANGANGFREMNNFVKTRKAFGAFYRDLREINLVLSESMMEGNLARNKNNRDSIDAYYEAFGKMPEGQDAQDIFEKSNNVGFATSAWNMPVIFITNRIVFDDLLRGFKAPSVLADETISGSARHFTKNKNWTSGQDVYDFMKDTGKMKYLKKLYTSSYSPLSRKYAAGNISEGLQETFQDIASEASNTYYEKKYSDPMASGLMTFLTSVGSTTAGQFSMKGLETFMSGFLMGSIVQGVGGVGKAVITNSPGAYRKIFKGEEFTKKSEEFKQAEVNIKDAANALLKDPTGTADKLLDHAVTVKYLSSRMNKAQQEGNQAEFQDARDEMQLEHLWTLASSNKIGMITEHLDSLQKLDNEGLAEATNVSINEAGNVRKKLSSFREKAQDFENTYNGFRKEFQNPFKPFNLTGKDKDSEVFKQELINYVAFDNAVKDAVIAKSLLKKNLERQQDLYNELVSSPIVANANATDINVLLSNKDLKREMDVLKNEISVLSIGTPEQKKEARIKQARRDSLENFMNMKIGYNDFVAETRRKIAELAKAGPNYKIGSKVINKRNGQQARIVSVSGNMVNVKYKDGTVKRLPKSSLETSMEIANLNKQVEAASKKLYLSYKDYIKVLSKQTDSRLKNDQQIDDAFIKIRDSFKLEEESEHMASVLNMLNNPEMFMEHVKRNAAKEKIRRENFADYIAQSFKNLRKQYKDNDFLNKLFDRKATIDPQDVEKIVNEGDMTDVTIYDATTGLPITEKDSRFNDIKKIIEEFAAQRKQEVNEESGEEVEAEEEVEQEKIDARNKLIELVAAENKKRSDLGEKLLAEDLQDDITKDWLENTPEATPYLEALGKPKAPPPAPAAPPAAPSPAPAAPAPAPGAPATTSTTTPVPPPPGTPAAKPVTKEMQEVKDALQNLNSKELELVKYVIGEDKVKGFTIVREDRSDYWYDGLGNAFWTKDRAEIEEKLEQVNEEASKFYFNKNDRKDAYLRVSTMKGEFTGPKSDAADRGTIIDNLLRDFIKGSITSKEELNAAYQAHPLRGKVAPFTTTLINDLYTIFEDVKKSVDSQDLEVISDIPTLWGTINGEKYAGTIDLLAIGKDGSVYIIDLKTASQNRRDTKGRFYDDYKKGDTIQQSAYAELLRQQTNINVKNIVIFPIQVSKERGKYTGAIANKDDAGKFTMPVEIDRSIFPETPGAPAPVTPAPAAPAAPVTPAVTTVAAPISLQALLDSADTIDKFTVLEGNLMEDLAKGPDHVKKTYDMTTKELSDAIQAKRETLAPEAGSATPAEEGTVQNYNAAVTTANTMSDEEAEFNRISQSDATPDDVLARLVQQNQLDCNG